MRFLAPLVLLACGPDLTGTWVGDPVCDGREVDAELELDKIDGGVFQGFIELERNGDVPFTPWTYDIEADYELTIRVDGPKEQNLSVRAQFEDVDCGVFNGPDRISEFCEDVGYAEDEAEDLEDGLEDMWWNGADQLEFDSDRCEGKLTRTAE